MVLGPRLQPAQQWLHVTVSLLLALGAAATGSAAPAARVTVACPVEVVGTWRLATSGEAEPRLISFATDGWANVLGGTVDRPAREFDILAQVRYQPLPPGAPRRIEFNTRRGNDIFPPGRSAWEIVAHQDESFTSRALNSVNGEQALWSRVQTHRYFLTFAARDTATRETAVFAMWTRLDGHKTELEALGTTAQGATARFGHIPQQLTQAFTTQSKRTDEVMLRLELNEAEYRRSHRIFEAWEGVLRGNDVAASDDPHRRGLELLEAVIQGVNRCGRRLRLADASTSATAVAASPQRRAIELVRTIRQLNDRQHLQDKAFPVRWTPPPVPGGAQGG